MTILALAFSASDTGIPVWVVGLAILCDTALLLTAMLTGVMHS